MFQLLILPLLPDSNPVYARLRFNFISYNNYRIHLEANKANEAKNNDQISHFFLNFPPFPLFVALGVTFGFICLRLANKLVS